MEVIEQVDRKFIACRITKPVSRYSKNPLEDPSLSEGILVLVDQHAADERIRVERLLKELCMGFLGTTPGVEVRELIPPRPVLLTQHEFLSIMGSQDILNSLRIWGVQVVLPGKNSESGQTSDPGSSGYVQIHVKTVPEIVGEKVGATFFVVGFPPFLLTSPWTCSSSYKEMNCEISSRDSLDKSKVESCSQILV